MRRLFVAFVFLAFHLSCSEDPPVVQSSTIENIIPIPVEVSLGDGSFVLSANTTIKVQAGSLELRDIGEYLSQKLVPATGFTFPVSEAAVPEAGQIFFKLNNDPSLMSEGYKLYIGVGGILLEANNPVGIFRGVQTIRQLLPAAIESPTFVDRKWEIPTGNIVDRAHYPWRGIMLDVARTFFPPETVKRLIDQMAYYKMNVLHLHLSDDQGWRLEIKSWPRLTAVGGSTKVGGGAGGYYTQTEFAEIVAYAQRRYITIIPEIEMPGHVTAALASYAELNCDGVAPPVYTGNAVGFSALCLSKELTYQFIEDVINELAVLTPGPYIHIGGDEANTIGDTDYIAFINKVQAIVAANGKQMIGWEEISFADLTSSSIAQHWLDENKARFAVKQGNKIIMSPYAKTYINNKYDVSTPYGYSPGFYLSVRNAYEWNLGGYVSGIGEADVLGVEAPLWTETVNTPAQVDFMVFPRLLGYAEISWSAEKELNWESYKVRLGAHGPRLKAMGINFFQSREVPWQ